MLWIAAAGQGELSTLQHAALAETLGLLYTLAARRGGHRALGLVAIVFYNLGLALLWVATGRDNALYYVIPAGLSISLLARIYRANLSRTARRGLRTAGSLVIYFATYYQVVQFDHGLYPLLLGGLTLAGIALGFYLQLRELFVLSIGFLVLDVVSNLAYYGVHRPVLGWTLLTLAGLCLTASGIAFQLLRRAGPRLRRRGPCHARRVGLTGRLSPGRPRPRAAVDPASTAARTIAAQAPRKPRTSPAQAPRSRAALQLHDTPP